MLWTICVFLLVLWLLGLVSGYTLGGVIHVLLVIAIFVVLIQVIQSKLFPLADTTRRITETPPLDAKGGKHYGQ